jgi:hypothetical protein
MPSLLRKTGQKPIQTEALYFEIVQIYYYLWNCWKKIVILKKFVPNVVLSTTAKFVYPWMLSSWTYVFSVCLSHFHLSITYTQGQARTMPAPGADGEQEDHMEEVDHWGATKPGFLLLDGLLTWCLRQADEDGFFLLLCCLEVVVVCEAFGLGRRFAVSVWLALSVYIRNCSYPPSPLTWNVSSCSARVCERGFFFLTSFRTSVWRLIVLYIIYKSVLPNMVTETKRSPNVEFKLTVCTLSSFRYDNWQGYCLSLVAYCKRKYRLASYWTDLNLIISLAHLFY